MRWQTQDADGAQLRDQLRQVAKVWEERGQPSDLLWTGPSFKEYEAWRERYAGGLTSVEEAFAKAMVVRAGQQRRRQRIAVTTAFVVLTGIAVGVSALWRRAIVQARRAEAAALTALGRTELAEFPTGTLAYAVKSLETHDSEDARRLALEALYRGPTAIFMPLELRAPTTGAMSPDGSWIAVGDFGQAEDNVELVHWQGVERRTYTVAREEGKEHVPLLFTAALHTLPLEELLAKLRALTNLRVVEDPDSPDGYRLDVGRFPGWKSVPTWWR